MTDLKYLFSCRFKDGTVFEQTPEDVSSTIENGSAFSDIVQRIDDVQVFILYNENTILVVDLETGLFQLNGIPFLASDPSVQVPPGAKLRLIYFRRVRVYTTGDVVTNEIEYHLGWQTTIDGVNYQQTIALG